METIYEMKETTVADIVSDNFRTAEVFKKYGIDFCCGGKKSIEQVCNEKNINAEILTRELEQVLKQGKTASFNFAEWNLTFLSDYIVNIHHAYVKNNLRLIGQFALKVSKVHGDHNPENIEINELWKKIEDELTTHMQKEEMILFPYIRSLEKFHNSDLNTFPTAHFNTVKSPIQMMENEHEVVGAWMHEIQHLSNNFTPPSHACNTYKVLYAKLGEFQDDLHQHIHLENNILFPKAIKLEESTVTL